MPWGQGSRKGGGGGAGGGGGWYGGGSAYISSGGGGSSYAYEGPMASNSNTTVAGVTYVAGSESHVNGTNSGAGSVTICAWPFVTGMSATAITEYQGCTVTPITITCTDPSPTSYQRYSNTTPSNSGGTSLGSSPASAQMPSFSPSVSSVGTFYYYCVITNPCGTVTSIVDTVTVVSLPAPGAVSALSMGSTTLNSTVATFSPASGSPTGYIAVSSIGALTGTPTNGQPIANGSCLGTNGNIVGFGANPPITASGLAANKTYTITVFAYVCPSTFGPGISTVVTTCAATPTVATGTPGSTTIPITFGADPGGSAVSPYIYSLNVSSTPDMLTPVTGYPSFGTVVTSPYTISGLNPNTAYYYTITATGACSTTSAVASGGTICPTPLVPTGLSMTSTSTSTTAHFTAGGPASGYIVVKSIGALIGAPATGQGITTGTAVGSNGVIIGSDITTNITSVNTLTPNTLYTINVYSYNNTA